MLDAMQPGTLEFWIAYDTIEGVGLTRLLHVLTSGFFRLLRKGGLDPVKNVRPESIDPWIKQDRNQSRRAMQTPAEQLAAARSISGGWVR